MYVTHTFTIAHSCTYSGVHCLQCRPVAKGGSLGAEEPPSLNKRSTILLKRSTILFKSHNFVKNILYFVKKVHNFVNNLLFCQKGPHFVLKNLPVEVSGYGLAVSVCMLACIRMYMYSMHTRVYVHMYIRIYPCACVYMGVYVCACTHGCIYVCVNRYAIKCRYVCTSNTYMRMSNTYVHTYMCIRLP